MPYIIVNDKESPWVYYAGHGFTVADLTFEEGEARRFRSLSAAAALMALTAGKSGLYAQGWRVVPVEK